MSTDVCNRLAEHATETVLNSSAKGLFARGRAHDHPRSPSGSRPDAPGRASEPHDSSACAPPGPGEPGSRAPQHPHHPRLPPRARSPSMKLNRGPAAQVLTIVRPVLVQPHHPSGPGRKRTPARGASRSLRPPGWTYRGASAQPAPSRLCDRLPLPEKAGLERRRANRGISGLSHWPHRVILGARIFFR